MEERSHGTGGNITFMLKPSQYRNKKKALFKNKRSYSIPIHRIEITERSEQRKDDSSPIQPP